MGRDKHSGMTLWKLLDMFSAGDVAGAVRYRAAVKAMAKHLGRCPTLASLTPLSLKAMRLRLSATGISDAALDRHCECLAALLRFAIERRLVAKVPPRDVAKLVPSSALKLSSPLDVPRYYASIFRGEHLGMASAATRARYDCAVELFGDFSRGDGTLQVDPTATLTAFRLWLADRDDVSALRAESAVLSILRIARHFQPDPLPSRRAEALPAPHNSLAWFYQTRYRIERAVAKASDGYYRGRSRLLSAHLGREAMVSDLNDAVVAGYVAARLKAGASTWTVKNERTTLCAFWRSAFDWGLLDDLPGKIPGVVHASRRQAAGDTFTRDEVERLLCATGHPAMNRQLSGHHLGMFLEALIRLALNTSLRLSRLLSLTWAMLSADDWLEMPTREGCPTRAVKCHRHTVAALGRIRRFGDARLIPFDCGRVVLYRGWQRLLATAKLPGGRREGPDKLCRTSKACPLFDLPAVDRREAGSGGKTRAG